MVATGTPALAVRASPRPGTGGTPLAALGLLVWRSVQQCELTAAVARTPPGVLEATVQETAYILRTTPVKAPSSTLLYVLVKQRHRTRNFTFQNIRFCFAIQIKFLKKLFFLNYVILEQWRNQSLKPKTFYTGFLMMICFYVDLISAYMTYLLLISLLTYWR